MAAVRRLLPLVAVLVFVDTMLYAALTPLLPHFAAELGLSKTGAGALVGAYAAGALIGGLPGGFAAVRLGARRAVLVGLTAMGLASLGFAFADSFGTLFLARLLQGAGSAFTWAGAFAWLLAAAPRVIERDRHGRPAARPVMRPHSDQERRHRGFASHHDAGIHRGLAYARRGGAAGWRRSSGCFNRAPLVERGSC